MYSSVESVFNEAVAADMEDEADEAAEYGEIIDSMAGLSDVNDSLRHITDKDSAYFVGLQLGDGNLYEEEETE